ncbi:MAG: hypothetical protein IJ106_01480 [Parasporobacterium sp.]|nr:hypothetical protein [Parasporobacterium sp.]MBQ9612256.1 hypothetical protein [Lachnospiraceae bacterium]
MNTAAVIGYMPMPTNFKYRDVFLKGQTLHSRYDDFSIRHPGMPNSKRAKIFSPFDALKGFNEAVAAKEVQYVFKRELCEDDRNEIDRKLGILRNLTFNSCMARANNVIISVTYYVPCVDKNNFAFGYRGQYKTVTGTCWGVDPDITRSVRVGSQTISFDDIAEITATDERVFHRNEWD